jgi:hypothetical protein
MIVKRKVKVMGIIVKGENVCIETKNAYGQIERLYQKILTLGELEKYCKYFSEHKYINLTLDKETKKIRRIFALERKKKH